MATMYVNAEKLKDMIAVRFKNLVRNDNYLRNENRKEIR